jgi:putative tributyrin esterase
MNLATMQFFSPALGRQVSYTAILPEAQQGPAPVLLQLHGLSDDHTAWVKFSNLVRHARPYPFIIVLPDGSTSFYADMHPHMRYESFLMEDLWRHVSRTFQVRPGPWAIGGLSMGGFGTIRLAAKYPDRFASAWSHSGFFGPRGWQVEKGWADAATPDPDDLDVFALTRRLAASGAPRPVITLDCGTEDRLIGHNRALHTHLDELGVAHTYREHPGAHTWEYWDEHVREALEQHARVLG